MTCNPYKGLVFRLAWSDSRFGISPTPAGADVALELCPRLLRLILPRPSLAPTFFQPLLCELAALRCEGAEGEVNSQSETGGVVGGVIGSDDAADGVVMLLSVSPRSAGSLDDVEEPLGSVVHGMLNMGKKPALGDRFVSSETEDPSRGVRSRDRGRPSSFSSVQSCCGATEARNGPRTESFISS